MTSQGKKKLGIIGGVGPAATARLFSRIVGLTKAETDQDHLDIVVLNCSRIPDRTSFLMDVSKDSFVPVMQRMAQDLERQGCEVIVVPCNTAHARFDEIAGVLDAAQMIHMPKATARFAEEQGSKCCGILATDGTIFTEVYQEALSGKNIEGVIPGKDCQKIVMDIIYRDVKAGTIPAAEKMEPLFQEFKAAQCDTVILGCTELSLLEGLTEVFQGMEVIDALDILALASIQACGAESIKSIG